MINIGDNEITIMIGNREISAVYAGDEQIYPNYMGELTGISIENLAWVTDIPYTGGTATSANCSFDVYAYYDSGKSKRITNYATITGSLVVPATTAETREMVGTLTLTASYSGFTDSDTVDVYQAKYSVGPVSITTSSVTININYTANTTTRVEAKFSALSVTGGYCRVFGSGGVWFSNNSYYLTLNGTDNTNYRYYVGATWTDNAVTGITPGAIITAELATSGYTFYDENGVVLHTGSINANYQPNAGFGIGGCYGGSVEGDRKGGYNTFYYFKIYEGNTLVRDLIPWEENGYGCLKDELTGNIYYGDTPSDVIPNYD